MSRIQRVLDKAEREGQVHRTTAELPAAAPPRAVPARPPVSSQPPVASRLPASAPAAAQHPPVLEQAPAPAHRPAAVPTPTPTPRAVEQKPLPIVVPNPVLGGGRRAHQVSLSPLLAAALSPGSYAAEQYRALRTRIGQLEVGARDTRSLLVTSPTAGDGKTVTSANLALSMAQEFHRKVLIIDADLRKGTLHRLFGLEGSPGLSDVLGGDVPLEEALVWIPEYRLTLLPAGRSTSRPTELLGSAEMRRTVDTLRTHFDRIVIDTPPALAALADVGVVAPLVDGLLLVVRAGQTPRPAIERALRQVAPARVLGLVLNDAGEPTREYADSQSETTVDAGPRAGQLGA